MTVLTRRQAATAGVFAAGILLATAGGAAASMQGSGPASAAMASAAAARPPAASQSLTLTAATAPGSMTTAMSTTPTGTVHTVKNNALGTILVNGKGFTLYRFDVDSNNPPASHCTGSCAALWTAAPAVHANSVKGVAHKLIGSVMNPNGTKQLTVAGWPVYTYTHDTKPGQTNGQGIGGTWWAVTPTGARASMSGGHATMPSGGGNGY